MEFLIIYLLGVCFTGICYTILYNYLDGYYDYMNFIINEVKKENDLGHDIQNMNNDVIINYNIVITSLFSYLGFLSIIISVISFIFWKNLNK